jgi:hypothetical protein
MTTITFPIEEIIDKKQDEVFDIVWELIREKENVNSCDKCGVIQSSDDLIWLTAEDFTPKEGEIIPNYIFESCDALCEDCYLKVVNANKLMNKLAEDQVKRFCKNNKELMGALGDKKCEEPK